MLKEIFKKYLSQEEYFDFFRRENAGKGNALTNYVAYIGGTLRKGETYDVKKCTQDDFYDTLKKHLSKVNIEELDESDLSTIQYIMEKIETKTLLPRQRTKENGIIPHQIHEDELNKILQNAKSIFNFLEQIQIHTIFIHYIAIRITHSNNCCS